MTEIAKPNFPNNYIECNEWLELHQFSRLDHFWPVLVAKFDLL